MGTEANIPLVEAAEPDLPPLPQGEGRGEGTPTATRPIDTSAKRFRGNVLANAAGLTVNLVLGIWYTPYLIRHLGVEAYGLVPLATAMTGYISIATISLTGSMGRFLTIDVARGDWLRANETFNTALLSCAVLCALLLPVASIGIWLAPAILSIPPAQETGMRVLLGCTVASFLVGVVGSSFGIATFVRNRLDIDRGIELLSSLTAVGVVVALFSAYEPRLWHIGVAVATGAIVRQAAYQLSWRYLTRPLRIAPRCFRRDRLREILGMGAWLALGQVGTILVRQTDLLAVNLVIGAYATGLYAPALSIHTMLRTLTSLAVSALAPTFVAYHALDAEERLISATRRATRLVGAIMALPVGLVCGLASPLLRCWLGKEYTQTAWVVIALVFPLSWGLAVTPFFHLFQAKNRVRLPAIQGIVFGGLGLGLALLLARGMGLFGIALGMSLGLSASHLGFVPWWAKRVTSGSWVGYLLALVPGTVGSGATWATSYFLWSLSPIDGWTGLILVAAASALLYVSLGLRLILGREDRSTLFRLVRGERSGPM